jgi:hypothetical protein
VIMSENLSTVYATTKHRWNFQLKSPVSKSQILEALDSEAITVDWLRKLATLKIFKILISVK